MIVTKENLLNTGYTTYQDQFKKDSEHYIVSFEKRFDNEIGKKYFIHIDCFDFTKINETVGIQYEAHVQFHADNGETFDVGYHIGKYSNINEMEDFYERMFDKMDCSYYEEF